MTIFQIVRIICVIVFFASLPCFIIFSPQAKRYEKELTDQDRKQYHPPNFKMVTIATIFLTHSLFFFVLTFIFEFFLKHISR